jgi:predicted metal-binding membrane protein
VGPQAPGAAPVRGTTMEAVLHRDRWLVIASLAAACLLCWAWLVPLARDMYGPMNGVAAWMATGTAEPKSALLLLAMWVVMMTGMMLPSAAPTLLLFALVVRARDPAHMRSRLYALGAGYLAVWAAFSLAAALLQWLLNDLLLMSPMMQLRSPAASGAVVLAAGLYQLTPVKRTCLDSCRAPAAFIARYHRPGSSGAFRLGLIHGGYCLGCCWALMLLLFAAGVMNLVAIAAITVFVLLEKIAPFGVQGGRLSAVLLIVCGVLLLVHAGYSGSASPEPPNSLGKSLSFGRPSRIRSTVSW